MEFINQAKDGSYNDTITIAILSNLSGEIEKVSKHDLKELCDDINDNELQLVLIGDNSTDKLEIPSTTSEAVNYLKEHCTTSSQMFENALNKVSFFAQKPKPPRGMPFSFELSKDFKIDLQLFVKISEEKLAIKFTKVTDNNEEVAKIREFEEVKDEMKAEIDEDDLEAVAESGGPQKVSKDDLIRGYHYGTSIIPFSDADKKLASVDKIGKCLQLVQFTKKANILPHFIQSECRYFLPSAKSETAATSLGALVQAMINLEVVAIARYAYNIISNPRLAVLIPKFSKTGCPVLQHFVLPFNEDVRGFDFPDLETLCEEPNDYQIDSMRAYIDDLMLVDKIKDENGKTQKVERCRIREIRNPRNQAVLMSVKRKALKMPAELSDEETKALLEMMTAPTEVLTQSQKTMNILAKSFDLVRVDPKKYEDAGIDGKSLNEINGGGKIEKWEDMDVS
jgi:ATP-dependent DNA helicase 2 subunit 2